MTWVAKTHILNYFHINCYFFCKTLENFKKDFCVHSFKGKNVKQKRTQKEVSVLESLFLKSENFLLRTLNNFFVIKN